MISSENNNNPSLHYSSTLGLLRTIESLQQSLRKFRESSVGSEEEDLWWSQCEKLLSEIENYKELLPEEISHLILVHALSSSQEESKLLAYRLEEDVR